MGWTARPSATGSPAASEPASTPVPEARWSRREVWALAGAFVVGIVVRLVLLPTRDKPVELPKPAKENIDEMYAYEVEQLKQ